MIKLLDCTLRDGGYNNNWEFGSDNIQKIFSGLVDSNMDIIECGFLTQKVDYNSNQSKYKYISADRRFIAYIFI
jgi:4-hydroxy 2-oxovalerate aldolase